MLFATSLSAQKNKKFKNAEERAVWNKDHNKPLYDGLVVIYNYKIKKSDPANNTKLIKVANTMFSDVIECKIIKIGNEDHLSVSTEGHLENNKVYQEILRVNSTFLDQRRWEILLK